MAFRHVTGHRPVLELLARAVSRGSVPPTLIFAGPEGVGKRLTAMALAQALNCENPVSYAAPSQANPGPSRSTRCVTRSIARHIARSKAGGAW
jgi:DNA polymerase III delta prime subunit